MARGGKTKTPKNIKLLGASSFFNDVGSEMITPILPFYINALGGGGVAVGLVSGLREGLSSLFKFFGGWLSDKTKKRMPFVFFGYLFSIVARFFLILANAWKTVVVFISFERFGKLRDPPRDAIITDSTKQRGHGFGFHQAMDSAGGVIGTLIVVLLFWKFNLGFKSIILVAALISILSLLPLFFVKEPHPKTKKKVTLRGAKDLNKRLKYFVFVASVFTLANFGMYMFLLLRAKELTGSTITALLFYVAFTSVYAIFAIPFGDLSDRIGRKKVLLLGYTLFVLVALGFTNSADLTMLLILFVLYGLVYAMTQSNQRAMVSDLALPKRKGTAFGVYESTIGLVNIPAGLIAGLLWDISYKIMFSYVAVVAIIAIILLMFVKEK